MNIKEKIKNCLLKKGFELNSSQEDINLQEYVLDSLEFINFILDLEDELNINIPDEYLLYDNIKSLNGFSNLLEEIIKDNN